MSTEFLWLNKLLHPEFVDSAAQAAVAIRHHHPEGELVQLGAVSGKTDNDASRLRPILLQCSGHQTRLSVSDFQLHATRMILTAEALKPALGLDLKLHRELGGAVRPRPDF